MAAEAQSKVQHAVTEMMNDLDRNHLRGAQACSLIFFVNLNEYNINSEKSALVIYYSKNSFTDLVSMSQFVHPAAIG